MSEPTSEDSFYSTVISIRLTPKLEREIEYYVKHHPYLWGNESVFVRSSVIWFIRCINDGTFKVSKESDLSYLETKQGARGGTE